MSDTTINLAGRVIPVTVRRYDTGGGYGDDGRWVDIDSVTFTAQMSVQPENPESLTDEVRAQGVTEAFKVYTDTALFTADEPGVVRADEIIINGVVYQINRLFRYRMGVLDHTKAIIFRLPQQRSAFGERIETTPLTDGFSHWESIPRTVPLTDDFESWAAGAPPVGPAPPLTEGFETWV